ncbi:MAG: bifunctional glutamate N-acetyltransferase/amino-acid acetyltransferase ArgJ, partial [Candidatus Binatia bacterium]
MRLRRRAHTVVVSGFRFAGVRAGLKTKGPDVALIVAEEPAVVAGVFTTNRAAAAPVRITRERVRGGHAQAVLVHAGNANACTGAHGRRTVELSTALVARRLALRPTAVLACATGKIGVPVPRDVLLPGVESAVRALDVRGFANAARAIMTTDAFPKTAVRRIRLARRRVTIAVAAKGGGMIAPDMATLLVFVMTDARITPACARRVLGTAVDATLNAATVDGDTSTNDTVLLLASGAAGNVTVRGGRAGERFGAAVTDALAEIAELVVADGEGATRVVEVQVASARSDADARRVARAIGESSLCKTAFHGGDPNWGRFVCAAGYAGAALDAERVDVTIGGVRVLAGGRP